MRARTWIATCTVIALLAVFAWALTPAPAPAQQRTFTWKVQSAFPVTDYPHRSLIELAKSIEQMSGGRLKIEPLPVGAVVGFFEVLDAVNRGALDGGPGSRRTRYTRTGRAMFLTVCSPSAS